MLADYIRQNSGRPDAPFLSINCAAVPDELMESELFGYERGAFTGAHRDGKPGLFELADGGTIFLDEVGELSLLAQSKLLRVLENGEFMRVGGQRIQKTDVRIVAATNRDLKAMIENRQFRSDLYYRLCVIPVEIPPLRERRPDVEPLARFFLEMFNRKHQKARTLSDTMLERLEAYAWPGNIRELRNTMESYVITGEMLHQVESPMQQRTDPPSAEPVTDPGLTLKQAVEQAEKVQIQAALRTCMGDVNRAAERLGIHRSVLYKKINKYQLRHRVVYELE